MRLLTKLNRRMGDVEYRTWWVHPAVKDVCDLGWTGGQELQAVVDGDSLIIRPRSAGDADANN